MSRTFAAGYIRIGVKEFLTMFEQHIAEIEKPDFQIQFVALGGYSVLELVLSTDAKVNSLMADLAANEVEVQEVYDRTVHILTRVMAEKDFSFDGSIVVYLYCLSFFDLDLAYCASLSVLQIVGLFWSRRLAFRIIEKNKVGHFRNVTEVSVYIEIGDRQYPYSSNTLLRAG